MKVLRDANLDNSNYQLARDVFMLSFYLGGMNYKDILNADFSSDMVIYCREKTKLRTKTQRVVKVPILPEAREILDRRTRRGKWCSGLNFTNTRDEISYIGKNLKKVVEMLSLPKYLTFYSARKSFAQYSLDLGINDAVTDYLMGHSDNRRGVISYYSRVTPRMAGVALRKIINYLENPEAYIEDIERAIMD
jgi:integrase